MHALLSSTTPDSTLEEKINWLQSVLEWVHLPATPDKNEDLLLPHQTLRIRFLVSYLSEQPELARKVNETFHALLFQSETFDLFYSTGIEQNQGFVRELIDRSVGKIIPTYRELTSLKYTFEIIFSSPVILEALRSLSSEDVIALTNLICTKDFAESYLSKKVQNDLMSAIHQLSARAIGIIIEPDLRERLPQKAHAHGAFFQLQRYIDLCISGQYKEISSQLHPITTECYNEIFGVYPVLESAGVSVDVVYKLEALQSILNRIDFLAQILDDIKANTLQRREMFDYLLVLAKLHINRSSLTAFLGNSLNMIARKIVERSSITGEHYITRTPDEYREMFASGAGGGLITSITVLIKALISKQSLPLFFEGFFSGINYAASFTIIQLCHFTLATKTPAVTASTLASKLRDLNDEKKVNDFIQEAIALHRSAFIAVLANIGLVIPGSILIDYIWLNAFGHHLLSNDYALKTLDAHNPFLSLTLFYAVLTGGILWFSSILGGWIENWCVYRHQFDVFEKSVRVRKLTGVKLQRRLTLFLKQNIAGLSTNVILGFMLAFCGVFGKFFGLPLEVRHVTLSSGNIALAVMGMNQFAQNWTNLLGATFGVLLIGLLNFSVSFTLSLFVAARARDINLKQFPQLIKIIFRRYRSSPKEFYFP